MCLSSFFMTIFVQIKDCNPDDYLVDNRRVKTSEHTLSEVALLL